MNSLDFFNSSVKNMEEKRAIPEDTYFFILEYTLHRVLTEGFLARRNPAIVAS